MPYRNTKMSGVLNNNDSSNSEMSYVDMHDLHPVNVQAEQLNGTINGAVAGGTLAAFPAAIPALLEAKTLTDGRPRISGKPLAIGAGIVAVGAIVMGAIRGFTAKKEAETHNAWSDRVLARMEKSEQESRHMNALAEDRERAETTEKSKSAGL